MLEDLNQEQQEAVTTTSGPMLVIAGAGSGKTRVVTYRIAHLIQEGIHPSAILGLTFTNKAAKEMKERVMNLTHSHVLISTFHSLGARILRESIEELGYKSNYTIYDDQDTDKLIKTCLADLYPEEKKLDHKVFKRLISEAKNALLEPHKVKKSDEPLFPKLYALYQERLKAYSALDFDDLLFLTVRLFQEHPKILGRYQKQWTHLLIDEYQDTNTAQYTMISLLVAANNNICVVGDPDQSIYSWRGANIRNILDFSKDYPGARVIRLERNYRSHSNILEAANALIKNNSQRLEKKLWSALEPGEKIKCHTARTDREEAEFISDQIRYHIDYEEAPLNQMVVFYRTNAQSRVLEDELLSQRIPYTIVGGISFYQRREIKDILAYLNVVQSDSDFIAFARTINLPKRGIGDSGIKKIRHLAEERQVPIVTFCAELIGENPPMKLTARQLTGMKEYVHLIQSLRKDTQSLSDLVIRTIEKTQYLTHLGKDPETLSDRKENLDALISKAIEWETNQDEPTLESFLQELSLKSSLDEMTNSEDRVSLMTIHNGKGLEFSITFLAGMEEDLFPHVNSRKSPDALEEERRLCYVGLTRAKKHLYLISCEERFIWGTRRTQRQSRFIREIPYNLRQIIY